jgi:predicted SAM-dependent methyltransferase
MVETIVYQEIYSYPKFQAEGNAAQFAIPFAKHVCKGVGVDVGCKKKEWAFPGAIPVDLEFKDEFEALNLPYSDNRLDYIFSSHCLEHIPNWVEVMDYWYKCLRKGGTLFLYLPDYSQVYWRPWNNRKHLHVFTPEIIRHYMLQKGYKNVFVSGIDLNNSFMVMGEK